MGGGRLINGISTLALLLAAGAGIVAGCGGNGEDGVTQPRTVADGGTELAPGEEDLVRRAQERVRSYCGQRVRALAGQGNPPSPRDFYVVTQVIEELGVLAAEKPEAETAEGVSVRLALGDIAEDLEGTNCDPRLVEQIDQLLSTAPPG